MFGRSESPPAGVAEQLSYYGIGNGVCDAEQGGHPRISFIRKFFAYKEEYDPKKNDEPVIGEEIYVCFPGFDAQRPIAVAVRNPIGETRRFNVPAVEAGSAIFLPIDLLPGEPLGRHAVSARQGASDAAAVYTVRAPNLPLARVLPRRDLATGEDLGGPVRIVVVGLEAHRRIKLRIYRGKAPSGVFRYVTSVPAQLDANGEAMIEIGRTSAARPGSYLVVPNVRGLFSEGSALGFDLP